MRLLEKVVVNLIGSLAGLPYFASKVVFGMKGVYKVLPLKQISLLLCNLSFFRPKNLRVAMSASWLQAHLLNKILFFMSCRRYTAAANALLYI